MEYIRSRPGEIMYYKLPVRLQMFLGQLAIKLGQKTNSSRLLLWGMTHCPIVIDDDEYENI